MFAAQETMQWELFDNKLEVTIGDTNFVVIANGSPKRSVLGSVSFLTYINDVTDKILSSTKPFSDELNIYRPLHDPVRELLILRSDLFAIS